MKKRYSILSLLFFFPVWCGFAQNWQLAWSDEFEGNSLNTKIWNYETGNGEGGWGTNQMDYCTDRKENVEVKKGRLVITVHQEDYKGFQYTSGRINTKDRVSFKYGKIEARIKAPAGRGIGAAFWMLPQSEKYGWWPRSGEIDILETNGHETHTNYGTIHYMQWDSHQYNGKSVISEGDLMKEFHLYSIIWTENSIQWLLDNNVYNEIFIKEPLDGRRPFHEDFFLIISAGVGSDFSGKKIEDKVLPQTYEVDYVRVYKEVVKPKLISAQTSTDGREVELKFSESIVAGIKTTDLILTDQVHTYKIQSVGSKYRDNSSLVLTLEETITKNSEVRISFKENSIQSVEKQYADQLMEHPVVNRTEGADPMLVEACTGKKSNSVELLFSKNVARSDSIDLSEWVVEVNKKQVSVKQVDYNPASPSYLILLLEELLFDSSEVLVSYVGKSLKSMEGGRVSTFSRIKVRNSLPKKYSVPGRIEAENYLFCKGIMPEPCQDEGGGRNIGFIDTGDFMEYEIWVREPGNYRIGYRIAAAGTSGMAELWMDGKIMLTTELPVTYNWQSWKTVESNIVRFEQGVYRFRILAKMGGFNLNWIEMTKVSP